MVLGHKNVRLVFITYLTEEIHSHFNPWSCQRQLHVGSCLSSTLKTFNTHGNVTLWLCSWKATQDL